MEKECNNMKKEQIKKLEKLQEHFYDKFIESFRAFREFMEMIREFNELNAKEDGKK